MALEDAINELNKNILALLEQGKADLAMRTRGVEVVEKTAAKVSASKSAEKPVAETKAPESAPSDEPSIGEQVNTAARKFFSDAVSEADRSARKARVQLMFTKLGAAKPTELSEENLHKVLKAITKAAAEWVPPAEVEADDDL